MIKITMPVFQANGGIINLLNILISVRFFSEYLFIIVLIFIFVGNAFKLKFLDLNDQDY